MNQCKHCPEPVEAERYSMCKKCWWDRDPRNIKNGGTVDLEKYNRSTKMNVVSLNNRFLLEPYKGDRALKANTATGFAIVQQKVSVVGLTLLADAVVQLDTKNVETLEKGSKVYIREELLFTAPWAQKAYESDAIEGKFIIVDSSQVEFVVPKEEEEVQF